MSFSAARKAGDKRPEHLKPGLLILALLFSGNLFFAHSTDANDNLKERLRERLRERVRSESGSQSGKQLNEAKDSSRQIDGGSGLKAQSGSLKKMKLAGLDLAIWTPADHAKTHALIIFSHGFHGNNLQSVFLMEALAKNGFLVMAPNHQDALSKDALSKGFSKPELSFKDAASWTDQSYKNRANDIAMLLKVLKKDPSWSDKIDWSKLVLAGHSLGGYTALGLAGAWPSWKIDGVKAVLAFSPYLSPYLKQGSLKDLDMPVMYQGGSRDFGVTPFLRRANGAFAQTPSPALFVELESANHFAWSNLNRSQAQRSLICSYSTEFLNKYLNGKPEPGLQSSRAGVSKLEYK